MNFLLLTRVNIIKNDPEKTFSLEETAILTMMNDLTVNSDMFQ